jgi:peptidoglycan/xylan/chitin deacetylase (PgdA/CDA1 family)
LQRDDGATVSLTTIRRKLLRQGLAAAYGSGTQARLPILMYHRVLAEPDPLQPGLVHAAQADQQFKLLSELFNVLPLHEAAAHLKQGSLPRRTLCITFDDGYRDNHDVALPLLQRHGLTATFFIASGFLDGGRMFNDYVLEAVRRIPDGRLSLGTLDLPALELGDIASRRAAVHQIVRTIKYGGLEQRQLVCDELAHAASAPLPVDLMMSTEQVVDLARKGMSIGGHTVRHPILEQVDDVAAREEIRANREALTSILGEPPLTFAYPNGKPRSDYSARHALMVRGAGYEAAVSTAVGVSDRDADLFQLPRFVITEATYSSILFRLMRMSTLLTRDYAF